MVVHAAKEYGVIHVEFVSCMNEDKMVVLTKAAQIITLSYLSVCFVIIWCGNLVLWIYLRRTTSKASTYIKAIIIATLPVVIISLPLNMFQVFMNFRDGSSCMHIRFLQYITLFIPKLTVVNLIAVMSLVRYLDIINWKHKHLLEYTKTIVTCVTVYTFILCTPIVYEMYMYFLSATPHSVCIEKTHGEETPLPAPIYSLVSITFSVASASFVVLVTTVCLLRLVHRHEKSVSKIFRKKVRMDTRRIMATQILWISFAVYWMPYGILHTLGNSIAVSKYVHCAIILQAIAYSSFFTLPTVYYAMDFEYGKYIASIFKRILRKAIK